MKEEAIADAFASAEKDDAPEADDGNDFVQWCKAHGFNPDVLDADLEGYPLPHTREAVELIVWARKMQDATVLHAMLRAELAGESRPNVVAVLADQYAELRSRE